jgi:hypothetical protein
MSKKIGPLSSPAGQETHPHLHAILLPRPKKAGFEIHPTLPVSTWSRGGSSCEQGKSGKRFKVSFIDLDTQKYDKAICLSGLGVCMASNDNLILVS